MPSIHQLVFGGLRPSIEAKMLDPKNATTAHNTYLRNTSLRSFKAHRTVWGAEHQIRTIFKTPDGGGCCGRIMTWDHCVSVIPLPNPGGSMDYDQLIIFHHNGDEPQRYFRCEDIVYPMRLRSPVQALFPSLVTRGASAASIVHGGADQRAYTYTWVDRFGVESRPAPPSMTVQSWDDDVWSVASFGEPPANAEYVNLYRTTSAFEDGSQIANPMNTSFQLVTQLEAHPWVTGYTDNMRLLDMEQGTLLTHENNDPPGMDQVVCTESGYFVGYKDNIIYISEKMEPHNFPHKYAMTLPDKIVGIAAFYDTIFIGTTARPYRFNVLFKAMGEESDVEAVPLPFPEQLPLRSRFCLVPTTFGAAYASPRGIVLLPVQGPAALDSRNRMDEEEWQNYDPNVAAFSRGKYIANRSPAGHGFVYDVQDPSEGELDLGDFVTVDFGPTMAMHAAHDGLLYYAIGNEVRVWNDGTSPMTYTWKSKVYRQPGLVGFSVAKVVGSYGPPVTFNIYGGGRLYYSRVVKNSEPFRLPARGKHLEWQFELIGSTPVTEVHISTSMTELVEEATR